MRAPCIDARCSLAASPPEAGCRWQPRAGHVAQLQGTQALAAAALQQLAEVLHLPAVLRSCAGSNIYVRGVSRTINCYGHDGAVLPYVVAICVLLELGISIAIWERCGYGHSDVGADVPITTAICSMSGQLDTW